MNVGGSSPEWRLLAPERYVGPFAVKPLAPVVVDAHDFQLCVATNRVAAELIVLALNASQEVAASGGAS
jgi:hypothetical protein